MGYEADVENAPGYLYKAWDDQGLMNIMISDSEFEKWSRKHRNAYYCLADSLDSYVAELIAVVDADVTSGETRQAMQEYITLFEGVSQKIREIGDLHYSWHRRFLEAIDKADDEMYIDGCDPRDFTHSTLSSFKRYVNDAAGFFSGFFDNVLGNIDEKIRYNWYQLTKKKCGDTSIAARKAILDYMDYVGDDIDIIAETVELEDEAHAKHYGDLYDDFARVLNVIEKANEMFLGTKSFTVSEIRNLSAELDSIHMHACNTQDEGVSVTNENAEEFTSDEANKEFFEEYSEAIEDARADMGLGDAFTASVVSASESAYAEYFERHKVPDGLSGIEVYEYLIVKKQLAETITEVSGNELDLSVYLEDAEKMKKFLDYLKKADHGYGNDAFEAIMKAVKNASKIAGYTGDIMEIVLPIFWDYSKNQEVIASLANGMDADSYAAMAVRDLQEEYNNTYLMGIDGLVDEVMKKAVKKLKGQVKDIVASCLGSTMSKVNLATFALEQVAELSGFNLVGESTYKFDCLMQQNKQYEKAYMRNFDIVASGNYTDADLLNLNNSFAILKKNYADQFDLLRTIHGKKGNHDLKRYYAYMSKSIENAEIMDLASLQPLTFEEFMAQ